MVFASHIFLYYFLPAFLAAYYLSPRRLRELVLTIASYAFYGWWRPDFTLLMLFSTVVDYHVGRAMHRSDDERRRKRLLLISVCTNLGLLGYFKYWNFGIDNLNLLLDGAGMATVSWPQIVLPVGISFYTFQTMSYTLDIFRRRAEPVDSPIQFACYVSMFPQLIAGPIVRFNTIAEQLKERSHTLTKFAQGVLVFQCGLAKKVLLADVLAGVADSAFAADSLGAVDAWLGITAYAFQIYFDFSGYSDMAVGLGLMMGFRLPVNFASPYKSVGITVFWQRWHISLSYWLRDYLYIPLGGNRKGAVRTYVNLALVMLLGGLWHGANWTFIAWGAYQGFWLIVERLIGRRSMYAALPRFLQIGVTFVIVLGGWTFFRAADIGQAMSYFASLFGTGAGDSILTLRPIHQIAMLFGALIVWGAPSTQALVARGSRVWALAMQPAFLLALAHLHYEQNVPFLYFQF